MLPLFLLPLFWTCAAGQKDGTSFPLNFPNNLRVKMDKSKGRIHLLDYGISFLYPDQAWKLTEEGESGVILHLVQKERHADLVLKYISGPSSDLADTVQRVKELFSNRPQLDNVYIPIDKEILLANRVLARLIVVEYNAPVKFIENKRISELKLKNRAVFLIFLYRLGKYIFTLNSYSNTFDKSKRDFDQIIDSLRFE